MWTRTPITVALIAIVAAAARAQSTAELAVGNESRVWIEGSSNIHSWSCSATAVDATTPHRCSFATNDSCWSAWPIST